MKIAFRPKLLDCLPGYNRAQFGKDLASGITVGVLALPLAMAFAIASGVSPTAGIWTAIVAGFLISALGGSRVQIGGPTGAFIPIIYGIVAMHGFVNLLGATMLAGFALRKQDIRLPNVLAELLNAGTTFADIAQVMRAVFPDDMARMGWGEPGEPDGQARGTAAQQEKPAVVRDETRENAMKMFGQPAGAGERKE